MRRRHNLHLHNLRLHIDIPFGYHLRYLSCGLGGKHFLRVSIERILRATGWALLVAVLVGGGGAAVAAPVEAPNFPSAAERIFASVPQRLLQIRTLVVGAGEPTSTGSGFLVGADGLAITNYHVVSQAALEPNNYRLEYAAADGGHGEVRLLAIDLPNDLAVVGLDKRDAPFFTFDDAAVEGSVPKGERLYSMGNPLDLGFTINEGTYNGLVERSYSERIHFTGALNPGMSGGPTVNAEGEVVGVNVAKNSAANSSASWCRRGSPRRCCSGCATMRRNRPRTFARRSAVNSAPGRRAFTNRSARTASVRSPWGRIRRPRRRRAGSTARPRPMRASFRSRARASNSMNCRSASGLFIANDLNTGLIQLSHSYIRAVGLNQFQFANFLTQQSQSRLIGGGAYRKWYTPQRCHEDFVATAASPDRPALRVVWCAQPYREFAGLYDVAVTAVTEDHGSEALVSRLGLQAVGYDDAVALSKRFLEAVRSAK